MLSQQTSSMDLQQQQHQRHHRRQYSAPSEIEATHLPQSPLTYQQTASFEGASLLSQPMEQLRQYVRADDKVGVTNTGHNQQHYLQVAQQHCQARPGQLQQQTQVSPLQISEQQFRTLQHLKLEAELDSLLHPSSFSPQTNGHHFVKIERSRSNPESINDARAAQSNRENVILLNSDTALFPLEQAYTQNDTALSSDWPLTLERPFTPPHQSNHDCFPATPVDTPHGLSHEPHQHGLSLDPPHATVKSSRSPANTPLQSLHDSFELYARLGAMDPDATIRSARNHQAHQKVLQHQSDMDFQSQSQSLPSPPRTVPMRTTRHFDVALLPNSSVEDLPRLSFMQREQSASCNSPHDSTSDSPLLMTISNFPQSSLVSHASDVVLAIREQDNVHEHSPLLETRTSVEYGAWDLPVRTPTSPRNMAMTDLSLDATIEDTGISAEEVQAFMSEQDSVTGKWTCMYPECGKLFGRKENIRSHVQTHLNDRQFKCVHCNKRFVRQHDLKRHAKIHSGVKPYPCRCGNSFARHDALTRHRQRGICDGGFAGVVKKIAKRGRPRKERPDDDERADKSSRTRKRAFEKSNYASSVSGTSESSFPDSPPTTYEGVDMNTVPSGAMSSPERQSPDVQLLSFPPSAFSYTPPMSPYSTGIAPSPTKEISVENVYTPSTLAFEDQNDQAHTPEDNDMELMEALRDSPMVSQPGTPPGLSHSSPQSSTARLHDLELSGVFNQTELEHSDGQLDYDMFAGQLDQPTPGSFGSSWNANTYFDLDKDLKGFTPDFDDEDLFKD